MRESRVRSREYAQLSGLKRRYEGWKPARSLVGTTADTSSR